MALFELVINESIKILNSHSEFIANYEDNFNALNAKIDKLQNDLDNLLDDVDNKLEDFKEGLHISGGKLQPKRIPGGVILREVDFTLK